MKSHSSLLTFTGEMIMSESNQPKQKHFSDVIGAYLAEIESEEGNFEQLLKLYDNDKKAEIRVGERVKGKIISIGKDLVFVDIGAKIDGFVDKSELADENGLIPYQVNDEIELYIVAHNENEIHLSKAISSYGGLNLLEEAFKNGIPVEGKVKEICKGGFHIEILQRRAFCPSSQIDIKLAQQPNEYVGQVFRFLITKFEEKGNNIVVSRRDLLEKELEKAKEQFLEKVSIGSILEGKVIRILPHGAIVELIPGLEGMVHVSELSWSILQKPQDVVKEGDVVSCKVIKIESDQKSKSVKIGLSLKQVLGDPWDSVLEKFQPGDKTTGKVKGFLKTGAFVELIPGVDGFVHISEMSYKKRITRPESVLNIGDEVEVMIKEIDVDKRRISLSIKDAEGDPWIKIHEKYQPSQVVTGIIEKKENFGFFVTLEPGITGLLPKSKIKQSHQPAAIEKLSEGSPITVIIEEINPQERKITLGPSDPAEDDDWKKYTRQETMSLGTLGDKLQKALNSKIKK